MSATPPLPDVEIAGVCDLDPDLAQQVAARYGAAAYADPARMVDELHPAAVSLCTPRVHPQLTELLAARGVHVLAEKPMASTVEGCQAMIDSCRRHGVVLMLGHKKRFAPPFVRLHELTTPDGELGPIRQVTLKYLHPGMSPKDWFWSEEDGGGPILENHVHAADTLGFLAGAPQRVYAEGATRFVAGRAPQPSIAAYAARFSGRSPDADVVVSVGYGMVGPIPARPFTEEQWSFGCERGARRGHRPLRQPPASDLGLAPGGTSRGARRGVARGRSFPGRDPAFPGLHPGGHGAPRQRPGGHASGALLPGDQGVGALRGAGRARGRK